MVINFVSNELHLYCISTQRTYSSIRLVLKVVRKKVHPLIGILVGNSIKGVLFPGHSV